GSIDFEFFECRAVIEMLLAIIILVDFKSTHRDLLSQINGEMLWLFGSVARCKSRPVNFVVPQALKTMRICGLPGIAGQFHVFPVRLWNFLFEQRDQVFYQSIRFIVPAVLDVDSELALYRFITAERQPPFFGLREISICRSPCT